VGVLPNEGRPRPREPLDVQVVADAVAGPRVADAVLGSEGLQKTVVVGVVEVELYDVVVQVLEGRGTRTLSTPIRSNCRNAIVPVASCRSVWSILKPTSSPGSSEPLTRWSPRILATRGCRP
jgi:hypothetical protein